VPHPRGSPGFQSHRWISRSQRLSPRSQLALLGLVASGPLGPCRLCGGHYRERREAGKAGCMVLRRGRGTAAFLARTANDGACGGRERGIDQAADAGTAAAASAFLPPALRREPGTAAGRARAAGSPRRRRARPAAATGSPAIETLLDDDLERLASSTTVPSPRAAPAASPPRAGHREGSPGARGAVAWHGRSSRPRWQRSRPTRCGVARVSRRLSPSPAAAASGPFACARQLAPGRATRSGRRRMAAFARAGFSSAVARRIRRCRLAGRCWLGRRGIALGS
jgi:hypothetical protein